MIEFSFETDFQLGNVAILEAWISNIILSEGFELGELSYVFCDDDFLHKLNLEFLDHDTLTDILTFDYRIGKQISGEIFISIDRVSDNASLYRVQFKDELHRVMIHGVLHLCGYKDESDTEKRVMRQKEDEALGGLAVMLQP